MSYEKTFQDNICNIKNLEDTSTLKINVYFNKYYYDKINEDTNFNDYVLLSEYNLLPGEEVQLTLKEDGNYSLVLFDEINNITTTIDIRVYINYRLSMIKDYLISFCLDNSKYNNEIEPDNYPKNLQGILNEYISLESIINYAFLNNYFNNEFFTLYLENAYKHYRHLFIPDTLNQRQYLNYVGKYNTKYSLCNKIASIFIIGFYLTDIAINTDTKINKLYSINRIKRCINKFGLVYETLRDIYYIKASIPSEDLPTDITDITDIPVITNNVSNITENSVTLNGIIAPNNNIISEKGFEWKLSTDSTFTKAISSTVSNIFNIKLNNLTPNSEYIYKAYVKIGDFIFYGNEITFTTNDIFIVPPIVVTNAASMITKSTATISGATVIGTETILQRGLQWKNTQSSDWNIINLSGISFSYNLNGLVGNTEYEFRAFANTNSGVVYGESLNFTTLEIIAPVVITLIPNPIGLNTATLLGTITPGSEAIISRGFHYKTTSQTWQEAINIPAPDSTNISSNITGLQQTTSYNVRAYVTTASGTVYGFAETFMTQAPEVIVPIVVTNITSPITQTTATLNGEIIRGSEEILSQGFEWKLTSASTWSSVDVLGNTISHVLTELTHSNSYQVRAFATTASGTTYGITYSFNTLAVVITPPTVTTNPATMITQDSSTISGTIIVGTNPILSQGFELKGLTWSTWSIFNSTLVGNNISNNIIGLVPNTTYEFRAFATTVEGKVYGATHNFATLAIVPPKVTTSLPTEITNKSAILNGIITQGSEPIINKGFFWRTFLNPDWIRVYVNEAPHRITLENLVPHTVYEFRAFANTATDAVYGEPLSFTTLKEEFNIYFGVADTLPRTEEEITSQESTASLAFTTPEITKNINFIAFPETLTLVSVENNSFPGDFWYDNKNDLYIDKTTVDIKGVNYNVYCMTTFMPIAVGAKVILRIKNK